jgi:hypothetical protein
MNMLMVMLLVMRAGLFIQGDGTKAFEAAATGKHHATPRVCMCMWIHGNVTISNAVVTLLSPLPICNDDVASCSGVVYVLKLFTAR